MNRISKSSPDYNIINFVDIENCKTYSDYDSALLSCKQNCESLKFIPHYMDNTKKNMLKNNIVYFKSC